MGTLEIAILIVILGLLFDYTNGFHDAANVISTVIATRALAPMAAIVLTALLNTLGATQISGVAHTISTGLIQEAAVTQEIVVFALFGAILWNFVTWYFGLPSSSSYALIGGMVGASMVEGGVGIVLWEGLTNKVLIPMVLSPFIGFICAYGLMKIVYRFLKNRSESRFHKIFRYLQIGSGSLMALSHGLNDAQKSMGIIALGLFASGLVATTHIPLWVILACALMMGLGTATGGFRIINTVGFKITKLTSPQGFAAEISASFVILFASFLGMPISSSQMIVGSVSGVGTAKGTSHVQWQVGKKVVLAWICTLPGAALFSAIALRIMKSF
ncbi:MAG: inorganic phosphate transporter [Simkania sp.]|nr:inorganic phosphate transporter [Simkania sp.]